MKILALDLATKTGWAFGHTKEDVTKVHSGMQDFSLKRGESPGMRMLYFDKWVSQMIADHKPNVVAFEMPHQRGGSPSQVLLGLLGILYKACAEAKVEFVSVHSATLKKFATGGGRASKEEMRAAASSTFGREIKSDDEADALHIWNWAKTGLEKA